jgi:hypothetical protein
LARSVRCSTTKVTYSLVRLWKITRVNKWFSLIFFRGGMCNPFNSST